jgi:hypothetical protein
MQLQRIRGLATASHSMPVRDNGQIKGPLTWTEDRLALGNTVRHAPVRSGTEFSAMFGQKHF